MSSNEVPSDPIINRWLGIRSWREARKAIATGIVTLVPFILNVVDYATGGTDAIVWPWLVLPVVTTVVTFLTGNAPGEGGVPPIGDG